MIYKVPDISMWINLDQVTSVEECYNCDYNFDYLYIAMSSGKPIKMSGDFLVDHFMKAYLGETSHA